VLSGAVDLLAVAAVANAGIAVGRGGASLAEMVAMPRSNPSAADVQEGAVLIGVPLVVGGVAITGIVMGWNALERGAEARRAAATPGPIVQPEQAAPPVTQPATRSAQPATTTQPATEAERALSDRLLRAPAEAQLLYWFEATAYSYGLTNTPPRGDALGVDAALTDAVRTVEQIRSVPVTGEWDAARMVPLLASYVSQQRPLARLLPERLWRRTIEAINIAARRVDSRAPYLQVRETP